jgi:hypothetical protein
MKHSYATFFGDSKGNVTSYEDGVEFDSPRKVLITSNYITSLEKLASKSLNKCDVRLNYYDIFGNKTDLAFMMYENEFRALKADLGK